MAVRLHRFEAAKVAGSGSSRRSIEETLWTRSEFIQNAALGTKEQRVFDQLLKTLLRHKRLMHIKQWRDGDDGFTTRTAETIRLLGHTYEYWHRGRPGIDATRWEVVEKLIPDRHRSVEHFINVVCATLQDVLRDKARDVPNLFAAVKEVLTGVSKKLGKGDASKAEWSDFQIHAVADALAEAAASEVGITGRDARPGRVLVAGVGSGKTLAFMLPRLILVKRDLLEGRTKNAHLMLYPRSALAIDQFGSSLEAYAVAANIPIEDVHSEMGSYLKGKYDSVGKGIREAHLGGTPRLILSSLETLQRRMLHPLFSKRVLPRLASVTIDEVHLISGVAGAQVAMLLRRLRGLAPRNVQWTGASATIAGPQEHLSRLVGLNVGQISVSEPSDEEMICDGVVHHAFIRPSGLISTQGALVNATSMLLHARRGNLGDRPRTRDARENAPKTIGFADNLETLGLWNDDFRENERTSTFTLGGRNQRWHPSIEEQSRWSAIQREMPYAVRFHAPLQRTLETSGGRLPARYGGGEAVSAVREDWVNQNICNRCKSGEEVILGEATREEMNRLGILVHRAPHDAEDDYIPYRVRHPVFDAPTEVGSHHRCPFLIAGACTWFSECGPEVVKSLGTAGGEQRYEYANQATSRVQSSKTANSVEADDLTDAVFRGTVRELYGVGRAQGEDAVDFVLASPSLEVGVDLPNLEESILTQAIRNIASYRQKVGRAGRESLSEALNVVLARDSANDLHYYRQPRKLIDKGRLDPIPLKERNGAVAKSAAYTAIWDALVHLAYVPEDIRNHHRRHGRGSGKPLSELVADSLRMLENQPENFRERLRATLVDSAAADDAWVDDLVLQIKSELELLLNTKSGCGVEGDGVKGRAVIDLLAMLRTEGEWSGNGDNRIYTPPSLAVSPKLSEDADAYEKARKEVTMELAKAKRTVNLPDGINAKIEALVGGAVPDIPLIEEIIDQLRSLMASLSPEGRRALRGLIRALEDMLDATEGLNDAGVDLLALRLVRDYFAALTNDLQKSTYYLQDVIKTFSSFHALRQDPWFLSPKALYLHPHAEDVSISTDGGEPLKSGQTEVMMDEALHSFIPGMWTRRMPQALYKIRVGKTDPVLENSTLLQAYLERMEDLGVEVERLGTISTPPPGRSQGVTVVKPKSLVLRSAEDRSYIAMDADGPEILDGDEGESEGRDTSTVRVPRSFAERWVKAIPHEECRVLPHLPLDANQSLIDSPQGGDGARVEASDVNHPFAAGAFSSIQASTRSEITEFVYGLSRTVPNNGGGSQLRFRTNSGRHVAFGHTITTDGLLFSLTADVMNRVKENLVQDMMAGDAGLLPTTLNWLRVRISDEAEAAGTPMSKFAVEDVVAGLLVGWTDQGRPALTGASARALAHALLNEKGRVQTLAEARYAAKTAMPDVEGLRDRSDHEQRERRVQNIVSNMNTGFSLLAQAEDGEEEHLQRWIHRTLLMSLGVTLITAAQRLTGANERELAFALPDLAWAGEEASVLLYDRAEQGNGNIEVINRFLHIPNLVRNTRSNLPSHDFLTLLEEALLPCAQHHTDLLALRFIETNGERNELHESLLDLSEAAHSTWEDMQATWSALGVTTTMDGAMLPALHAIRAELAHGNDLHVDDVSRATGACWNGCPECLARLGLVQGGFVGLQHVDRTVLDRWYAAVRASREEYHSFHPQDLVEGGTGLSLGSIQNLAIRGPTGIVRSCLLPWTVGIEMMHDNGSMQPQIILRENDVINDRAIQSRRVVVGTPARGVRRLLWFDLLMTAYLDLRGDIPEDRREISLLFYDARDLSFEDIGIAPQMMEALRSAARADGFESFHRLSDVLGWLVRRGFRVTVCLDAGVIRNERNSAVRKFLRNLRDRGGEDLLLMERRVVDEANARASMHKKVLITPIFLLMGSSNLTRSGAGRNEEIEAHVQYGDHAFDDVMMTCRDTMSGAYPIPEEAYALQMD